MASHVFKIEAGKFGLTLTDPLVTEVCEAVSTAYNDYTCQITSGALEASPNVSDETVPATWCDPEQTLPMVGATSYELTIAYLQDPDVVDGLSQFLFEHDTELAWFFMGLDGENPPKAIGQVRLVSGAIGGEGRVTLTAEATLPVDGKPAVCFGTLDASEGVGGGTAATGATAGSPGSWTPGGSTPAADAADATTKGVTANPTTAWTTGQYVQGTTTGTAGQMSWDGTAWVVGQGTGAAARETVGAGAKGK